MKPGGPTDVRLGTAQVIARLGVTERHLRRMVDRGFPAPHYLGERKRWWLSEVLAWEEQHATKSSPAAVARGLQNLRAGGVGHA